MLLYIFLKKNTNNINAHGKRQVKFKEYFLKNTETI